MCLANGLRGTARAGRWLFWGLVVLAVPVVLAGAYLGRPGDLGAPVVPVESLTVAGYAALAVSVAALGLLDPALGPYLAASSGRGRGWGLVLVAAFVLLLGLGLLLVFGGAVIAPSLAFFILPANLGAVPGGLAVGLFIVTFLLATCVAGLLAGAVDRVAGETDGGDGARRRVAWAAGMGAVALLVAVLPTTAQLILLGTALLAVAAAVALLLPVPLAGRRWSPRIGFAAGVVTAVAGFVLVAVSGQPAFGPAALAALAATAAVTAVATLVVRGGGSAGDVAAEPVSGSASDHG